MGKKFKSILLIDDNVADNRYNQIILGEMNIVDTIEIAKSGEEALAILESTDHSQPKLILLDLNMRRMTGWEFLEAYEKMDAHKKRKMVVVIVTTSMNPEDRAKAAEISCVAEFHSKPLTPAMLHHFFEKLSFPE